MIPVVQQQQKELAERIFRLEERMDALEAWQTEVNARLTALEQRVESSGETWPDMSSDCRAHTCTYYQHYLAYGGPDLTHEGYHAAETFCVAAQEKALNWDEKHADDSFRRVNPYDKMAHDWEVRVRA